MFLPTVPPDFYRRFKDTFGIRLAVPYWDSIFGFDVVEFDAFIHPNEDESTEDAVRRIYGEEALQLVKDFLAWEKDQFEQRAAP